MDVVSLTSKSNNLNTIVSFSKLVFTNYILLIFVNCKAIVTLIVLASEGKQVYALSRPIQLQNKTCALNLHNYSRRASS